MLRAWTLPAALALALGAESPGRYVAPSYSVAGIVNAASGLRDAVTPNAVASVYGWELSYETRAFSAADLIGGDTLPTQLGGISVFVGRIPAPLLYVSPSQVNFVVPASLDQGDRPFQLVRQGTAGPLLTLALLDVAPALFAADDFAVATHADGSAISPASPARPGEVIVLYGTGLGRTRARIEDGRLTPVPPAMPLESLLIEHLADLSVLLNGAALESWRIQYAGLTPGTAGVYQINLQLPDLLAASPEIQVRVADRVSPPGLKLCTLAAETQLTPAWRR